MYRLQLKAQDYPDLTGQYYLCDCDLATFVDIATGIEVMAVLPDQELQQRGIFTGNCYFTAVWNPEVNDWCNTLSVAEAEAVYDSWWRQDYP